MGVVYEAYQVALKRRVALKMVLAGSLDGPERDARFQREAEAVARLHHPNIAEIHEIGEFEGRPTSRSSWSRGATSPASSPPAR